MKLNHTIVFYLTVFVLLSLTTVAQTTSSAASASTNAVLTASGTKTGNTLATSAAESPDHTTLLQLLKASGLTKQASGAGPYTVFAPTNGAFSEFSKPELDELLLPSNKARLIQLLGYHVVKGRLTSDQLRDGQTLTNLTGQLLTVHKQENYITIEDGRGTVADVIQGNIRATNGVVYSINKVLQAASAKGPIVR